MQYRLLIMFLLVLTISCKVDRECPEPDTPIKEEKPKEKPPVEVVSFNTPNFEDNSSTPFADIPPVADPIISAQYRLKKKIFFYNPAKENPGAYLVLDYDANGNIIKESYIDFPNTLSHYLTNEYKEGKLYKKSYYAGEVGKLTLAHYITYEYQNNKLVKMEDKTNDDNIITYWHYEYARNRLVTQSYYSGGKLQINKFYYDSDGKLKQEAAFFSKDLPPSSMMKYKYDKEGREIRIEYLGGSDKLLYIIDTKYSDGKSLPSETIRLTKDEVFENKRKYSYNENGFVTELLHEDASGTNPLERNIYQDGLIREKRTYSQQWGFSEATMTKYEYERN